eukprot:scaffold15872_cov122-Isochrysis_galbana.AAC.5
MGKGSESRRVFRHGVSRRVAAIASSALSDNDAQIAPRDTAAPAARLGRNRLGGRRWSVGRHLIQCVPSFWAGSPTRPATANATPEIKK